MNNQIVQNPFPGARILRCAGDLLEMTLDVSGLSRPGRAFVRTNIACSAIRRREIIDATEKAKPYLAADWRDIPMRETAPGVFLARIPLASSGFFQAKAFFLPDGEETAVWPDGENISVKVAPAFSVAGNSIYTAFVRQFRDEGAAHDEQAKAGLIDGLAGAGYAVIPPSGTFRNVIRRLDHIIGTLGFRILQLLPVHPVPTTYARMGRYGSPFASTDFFSVDPAYAEFDGRTTPLQQFDELADAVHARGARLFIDLPANHTGWASAFQTSHPEWFRRKNNGDFLSPGAWGVVWADLVELDYSLPELRAAMAEVFLFWCRHGVDGFRCDAGYMIPADTWKYIVARVREAYPETVFMLEGLGGKIEVTEDLLTSANLDWAYSELFQEENRDAISYYLGHALPRSEAVGPLVHFAETHDNNRLAARGSRYAAMRTALSALLSQQGAFGITAGVEWFCADKIDVHGALPLNWGATENQIGFISRLNAVLASHPSFCAGTAVRLIQRGGGNVIAALRHREGADDVLVCANLDPNNGSAVEWPAADFPLEKACDLISGNTVEIRRNGAQSQCWLNQGEVVALTANDGAARALTALQDGHSVAEPESAVRQRRNRLALAVLAHLNGGLSLPGDYASADAAGAALADDPVAFCVTAPGAMPQCVEWHGPRDARRTVMVPPGFLLCVRNAFRFRATLVDEAGEAFACDDGVPLSDGTFATFLRVPPAGKERRTVRLEVASFEGGEAHRSVSDIQLLPAAKDAAFTVAVSGDELRRGGQSAVLANRRGAMAQVRSGWGTIESQYDALLAINANPHVPDNRLVFFTRCRAWVRHRSYSYELDASCTESFTVEKGGKAAVWRFRTPVGMGREVSLAFRLVLSESVNRVDLQLLRFAGATDTSADDDEPVQIILRPGIEGRDFHCKTLAYQGAEQRYPAAVSCVKNGFDFAPAGMPPCRMRVTRGVFHDAPEWSYSVSHWEDRERGLGPTGGRFSPGWFDVVLKGGECASLSAGVTGEMALDVANEVSGPIAEFPALPGETPRSVEKLSAWLDSNPLDLFIADRDSFKTVIAGYPWFLDWGRDTLIVLRGLLAAGGVDDALAIIREFGRFEENGTLPNIIHGNTVGNRDTTDAPLWYAVAVGDLIDLLGVRRVAELKCGDRTVRDIVISIVRHYLEGTPNGIRVDGDSGLVFSPSHFTWMDTNYPAGTPRTGYPVEIQALWIATLSLIREKFGLDEFAAVEEKARASLLRLYPVAGGGLADSIRADAGTRAADGVPEDALRPNQLLAVTLGSVPGDGAVAKSILRATAELLVPGSIRSLADRPVAVPQPVFGANGLLNDPLRPFWGEYAGDEDTRRKPAYHNGTTWVWQFPMYCEALYMVYGKSAKKPAAALLASVAGLMETGCLGQLPEITDGAAPHRQRGCFAQAWSMSEVIRVWKLLK